MIAVRAESTKGFWRGSGALVLSERAQAVGSRSSGPYVCGAGVKLENFSLELELPVPAEEVFAWHERPGTFERLLPPWRRVLVLERTEGIRDGARTRLKVRAAGLSLAWTLECRDYQSGRRFCDVQLEGPFRFYEHVHEFVPLGTGRCRLRDTVSYALPFGGLVARRWFRNELARIFRYRHATTRDDLALHAAYAARARLTVAVTGASGLVGRNLCALLAGGGHRVLRLVRHPARGENEVEWDPQRGVLRPERLSGIDALVHLAGENIGGGRWTQERLERIRKSRVDSTRQLVASLSACRPPPRCLVCASAIGIYGDRGAELLDEQAGPGAGMLPELCQQWEAAAAEAERLGARRVSVRFGVVLSPAGGMLARLLPLFRLGLGGPVGSGRQYVSWISVDDAVGAIHHVLVHEEIEGPVNVVAPQSTTSAELARALGRVLCRPAFMRVPAVALRLRFGRMADELLLASARAVPDVLSRTGYMFRTPGLEQTLRHLLGRPAGADTKRDAGA
jgi:uncharacterized protein (TIGR01777 family)